MFRQLNVHVVHVWVARHAIGLTAGSMVGLVVSVNNKLESSNLIGKSTECTLVHHARKIIDYHPFLAFTLEGNLRKIECKNNCGDSPLN